MARNNWTGNLEEEAVSAFIDIPDSGTCVMTSAERDRVLKAGAEFAEHADGIWLLISGRFTSPAPGVDATHEQVRNLLRAAFDEPDRDGRTIKVIVDSTGGNLDSAYATVLYLTAYAKTLEVYVPDSAKSASTLLAVGANKLFLSAFGELGPLDSQIRDPRNPVVWVSALDLYQSVDYVRDFGAKTVREVLDKLVAATGKRIPVKKLVGTASAFSLGVIGPMMDGVPALDFGSWGRSLMISERYAYKLLEARVEAEELTAAGNDLGREAKIAHQLVYGYPHHLFPIDINEANRIGLAAEKMDKDLYGRAIKVVEACRKKDFVGFISKAEAEATREIAPRAAGTSQPQDPGDEHQADLLHTTSLGKQS
jgi:Serine dehydrogenase proteinase